MKIKANFKNYHQSGICIGISSTVNNNKDFAMFPNGFHYVYLNNGNKYQNNVVGGNWTNYCNSCGVNDKIGILLDLKKDEIKFSINDIDQGIAYKNIKKDKNIKYRLMVSLCLLGAVVEIVKFSKK